MTYSLIKTPKTHAVWEVQPSKCPKFGKMRGKNPQLYPFYPFDFLTPFGYAVRMPLLSRISPENTLKNLKVGHSIVPILPSRNSTLTIAVKKYKNTDTKVSQSCPISLDSITLFQLLCPRL